MSNLIDIFFFYEIKIRTGNNSQNDMAHSFIADIQSITYTKLRFLDTDSPLRRSDTEMFKYSIELP